MTRRFSAGGRLPDCTTSRTRLIVSLLCEPGFRPAPVRLPPFGILISFDCFSKNDQGKTLVLDSMDDLNLVFDLLIHTAPKDRSRAIDRYARAARLAPETDEALVLEAMRRARFSVFTMVRRHTVAGLIVKDLFRGFEFWLVDEGLESSLPDEAVLATRLYTLEGFAMTAGVLVSLDIELIEYAIADTPQLLRKGQEEAINDRRFAESIYRAAVASGIMERVAYQDTIAEAG